MRKTHSFLSFPSPLNPLSSLCFPPPPFSPLFPPASLPTYLSSCSHRMDFDEVKRRLQRFAVMDRDKDGYITAEDLAHYLNVPSDACLHAVFSALNTVSNVRFGEGQGEEREGRRAYALSTHVTCLLGRGWQAELPELSLWCCHFDTASAREHTVSAVHVQCEYMQCTRAHQTIPPTLKPWSNTSSPSLCVHAHTHTTYTYIHSSLTRMLMVW